GWPLLVRSAGVKTYLYHWMRALEAVSPRTVVPYFAPRREKLDDDGGPRRHFFRLAALWALNGAGAVLADYAAPRCDLFHVSNQLRHPPRRPKLSSTVHDLTSWIVPECHTPASIRCDRDFAHRILARAHGLIAVSE